MSELLKRLRRELSAATDTHHRIELLALVAANLAREGKFDDARNEISEARAETANAAGSVGTLWIMLAEGLISFFEHQSTQALDRIRRAQTLGLAMRYKKLVASASAWKAHIEFDSSDFIAMVRSLQLARESATESDHDAQTRLAIVLCNAFAICGDQNHEHHWFHHAHDHAIKNGDHISVDALIYNKPALSLARLRVESCIGGASADSLNRIRAELASSTNLTLLVGSATLPNYPVFIAARLALLEGNYDEAIAKLQAIRHERPFASNNFDQAYVDLELCYCHFRLNQPDAVSAYLAANHPREFPGLDIDEQIVAAWMFWQMSVQDPRFGDAPVLQARFDELHTGYTRSRAALLQSLQPFMQ